MKLERSAAVQAVEVQEQAQQHTAQAGAAGERAAAAEEQAQQFEAQGKFADAASAALQADRYDGQPPCAGVMLSFRA